MILMATMSFLAIGIHISESMIEMTVKLRSEEPDQKLKILKVVQGFFYLIVLLIWVWFSETSYRVVNVQPQTFLSQTFPFEGRTLDYIIYLYGFFTVSLLASFVYMRLPFTHYNIDSNRSQQSNFCFTNLICFVSFLLTTVCLCLFKYCRAFQLHQSLTVFISLTVVWVLLDLPVLLSVMLLHHRSFSSDAEAARID